MKDIVQDTIRNDSMLIAEDLETIESTVYEANREELIARTIFALNTDAHPGDETQGYDIIEAHGQAVVSSSGADDIPTVGEKVRREYNKIMSLESAFKISKQEQRKARKNNRTVKTYRASTARRSVSEQENTITFVGDADYDVEGVLNVTGLQEFNVPTDADSVGTEWTNKTGFEKIADIRNARGKVAQEDGFMPDTLVLPPAQYEQLQEPINQYNTNTIMSYLEDMGWFDTIVEISDLTEGDPEGANDVGLVLDTNPENMELGLAMDIAMGDAIKQDNGSEKFNLEERFAGLMVRKPKAICRFDGI